MNWLNTSLNSFKTKTNPNPTNLRNLNYEPVEEKLKMALSNNFTTRTHNWKLVGLTFYSVHKRTDKFNNDLNNIVTNLLRKANDSGFEVPVKLFETTKLSNASIDVHSISTEEMIKSLIYDNIKLLIRVDSLIHYARTIGSDEYIVLLETLGKKFEDNREKLNAIVFK